MFLISPISNISTLAPKAAVVAATPTAGILLGSKASAFLISYMPLLTSVTKTGSPFCMITLSSFLAGYVTVLTVSALRAYDADSIDPITKDAVRAYDDVMAVVASEAVDAEAAYDELSANSACDDDTAYDDVRAYDADWIKPNKYDAVIAYDDDIAVVACEADIIGVITTPPLLLLKFI